MKATQFWEKYWWIDGKFQCHSHKTKHSPDFITNQMGQLYILDLHNCLYHRWPHIGLSHSQNIQFIYHNSKKCFECSYGEHKKKVSHFPILTPWESWIELLT